MSGRNSPNDDSIEDLVSFFLRTVPETWTDHGSSKLSELQERAIRLLTAAGMIERRVTFRLRMAGQPVAVEATISLIGEVGLAQAMRFVLKETWNEWQKAFEEQRSADLKVESNFHCERIGDEQWRLTAEGVVARKDLDTGNAPTVFDFVLRRGFFDGQPRLLPDGGVSQRLPVAGRGALERIRRVSGDTGPTGVAISNWEAGAQAFASAFAVLLKAKQAADEPTAMPSAEHPSFALLRLFTNGIVDERIEKAAVVLADDKLTANEKLTKIDGLMPLPATASAEQLGEMLGVTKQAVMKTEWWRKNRRGESQEEIDRRFDEHERRRGAPIDRRRVNRKDTSSEDDGDER
jgi:hypothetical protein